MVINIRIINNLQINKNILSGILCRCQELQHTHVLPSQELDAHWALRTTYLALYTRHNLVLGTRKQDLCMHLIYKNE